MKRIKKMTPEQIVKIKELFAQGISPYQIHKALKVPAHVAKYYCDKVMLERAKTTIPSPVQERLEYQESLSAKQKNKMLIDFIVSHFSVQ